MTTFKILGASLALLTVSCASLTTMQNTGSVTTTKTYPEVVELLAERSKSCWEVTQHFFRDGIAVSTSTTLEESVIYATRYATDIGKQPPYFQATITKTPDGTQVSMQERNAALGLNKSHSEAVKRWLDGDIRCKIDD